MYKRQGIKAVNPDLILLGPGSGKMVKAAKALGLKTAGEVFADRAYMEDGTLVPVSYTHLDVYKRQPYSFSTSRCPTWMRSSVLR